MVFNHASALVTGHGRSEVVGWLADLARGIGHLVDEGLVEYRLRTMRQAYEVDCLAGWSLLDAILRVGQMGPRYEIEYS